MALSPVEGLSVALTPAGAVISWDVVTDADAYLASLDGASLGQTASTSLTIPTPAPGAHVVSVTPTVSPAPAYASFTVPPLLKQDILGFIDRNGTPLYPWMLGQVCNVRWDQLQASAGAALTANNPIDQALASVQGFNSKNKSTRGIRVRLFVGSKSPVGTSVGWPQSLGGSPVTVTGSQGQSGVVGHYWTSAFGAAYLDLQTKLAAKYDTVPEIRSVTLAMASLLYAEPLLKYSPQALMAAGNSLALEEAAITRMMLCQQIPWKQTAQTMSFNPADFPGIGGVSYTLEQITAFRTLFGKQGVLMNNSIRAGSLGADYDTMFAAIKAAGGPISFQTAVLERMGDPATTFAACVNNGAQSVELPVYGTIPQALLQTWQAKLVANAA